jgi:hypothetical protein
MATAFVQPPWAMPQRVSSVLVTAPTEEPLTVDEVKLRAACDDWPVDDPRNALVPDYIAAARAQVEHDTGLALLTQTRLVTIAASAGIYPIPWQAWPVQSMTDAAGRTVDPRLYAGLQCWMGFWLPGGSWTVVVGWPSAAALKAEAPLLVHAVGLLAAHYLTLGRDLAIAGGGPGDASPELVPMGYADAIAPYQLVVLP